MFGFVIICTFIFEHATQNVYSNVFGAPLKHTGSPGDGQSCSNGVGCHGGTPTALSNLIASDVPVGGYLADSIYTITATVSSSNVVRFGFEISPQDLSGNLLGTLMITDAVNTKFCTGSTKYVTHTKTGTNAPTHTASWQFNWKAPVAGTGDVTFYGAFNFTNNNTLSSGDTIHTSTLTIPENTNGIDDPIIISELKVFPNPMNNQFELSYYLQKPERVIVNLLDAKGSRVISLFDGNQNGGAQKFSLNLDEKISSGIYLLQLNAGEQMMMKKVVKL